MPRVTQAFRDADTWRAYGVGDPYEGPRSEELAALGFVEGGGNLPPGIGGLTAAQLRDLCAERGVEAPRKATKAQLLALLGEQGV